MTPDQLKRALPRAPMSWLLELCEVADQEGLIDNQRKACFIGQLAHESLEFTVLQENLNYSSAERIVKIFRTAFDLDKDKVIDPEEIAFAQEYVKQPAKLANRAYASRMGNGPEWTGDGWKFRGRGPIQITGRNNYTRCGAAIGVDIVGNPDLLLEPQTGVASAIWFWRTNGLNELADIPDHVAITKKINGGTLGLDDRIEYFNKVLKEIS